MAMDTLCGQIERGTGWARPPFSMDEVDFLNTCSRCMDCIDACPHQALFPLGVKSGLLRAGTPALDLCKRGCHLCQDWPCVMACKTGALALPESGSMPRLARVGVDGGRCPEGCDACVQACPPRAMVREAGQAPHLDVARCPGCGLCLQACPLDPPALTLLPVG